MRRWAPWVAWIAIGGPALAQIVLMAIAIGGRFAYPYDLEWMEGGLLQHAHRIADGQGIYGPPSVDFIPYLYTPLYPGILAVLGSMFDLTYQLGRAISIAALLGIGALAASILIGATRSSTAPVRAASLGGALLALGLFAASYPYVEGWYDLVRADTLFLFLATAGLSMAHRTARIGTGYEGHGRTAAAAAVLAMSFFCKQTGVFFVAAGGIIVLVANWRRAPTFAVTAGILGLGGVGLLQRASGGWFWTYAFEVHQAHDWNVDRFWMSFGNVLWRYPAASIVIALGLGVVAACALRRRRVTSEARTFLVWVFVYAVSTVTGAIAWGTEFAHFNAYMPALLHGALAAGAAIPALITCGRLLIDDSERELAAPLPTPEWTAPSADRTAPITRAASESILEPTRRRAERLAIAAHAAGAVAGVAIAAQLAAAWWHPGRFIPRGSDRRAGDALIAHLAQLEGEVWVPSHPWYAHLAGKRMYVHRMGIKDVTVRKPRPIAGLDEALRRHYFAAIVLDNRDLHLHGELAALNRWYQEDDVLPRGEQPRTVTGATVHPASIWIPAGPPKLPPGGSVIFDFEDAPPGWEGWTAEGGAWGGGSVGGALPQQGPVRRAGGKRWITSMHGGDAATGALTSPGFLITSRHLRLRVGGGTDPALRVELLVDGIVVRTVSPPPPASERFRDVELEVAGLAGRVARLCFVDGGVGAWGHLNVDEIWAVP